MPRGRTSMRGLSPEARAMQTRGSKFFSMNANPKGASVGNFVNNVKGIPGAFKEAGKAVKEGRLGKMIYNDMNPMGKKVVDTVANRIGYVSKETRAGMRRTNIAGKKGQLGKGWGM